MKLLLGIALGVAALAAVSFGVVAWGWLARRGVRVPIKLLFGIALGVAAIICFQNDQHGLALGLWGGANWILRGSWERMMALGKASFEVGDEEAWRRRGLW